MEKPEPRFLTEASNMRGNYSRAISNGRAYSQFKAVRPRRNRSVKGPGTIRTSWPLNSK